MKDISGDARKKGPLLKPVPPPLVPAAVVPPVPHVLNCGCPTARAPGASPSKLPISVPEK